MTVRKPNLFIIGAHKAGTSALRRHLMSHPQIFMCTPKEPSYFVSREDLAKAYPSMEAKGFWRSEAHYLKLFEDAGDSAVVGEASANYARLNYVGGVAERIFEFSPDASLIYIMRDPVERTISHYWYMVNMFGETRRMRRAIEEDPDYQDTSNYALQLEAYLNYFPMNNIFTLTTEEFRASLPESIANICDWLDVDKEIWRTPEHKVLNATPQETRHVRSWAAFHGLRQSSLWNKVRPMIPEAMLTPLRLLTETRTRRQDVPTDETVDYLRPIQRRQTEALSKLLGREFPEWTTLYGESGAAGKQ